MMKSFKYVGNRNPGDGNARIVAEYDNDGQPKEGHYADLGGVLQMTVAQAESLSGLYVLEEVDEKPKVTEAAKPTIDQKNTN